MTQSKYPFLSDTSDTERDYAYSVGVSRCRAAVSGSSSAPTLPTPQGDAPERPRTPPSASCCDDTAASAPQRGGLVRCTCGTWHGADDARWPRETPEPTTGVRPRPGLDAPVGTIAAPTRPPERLTRDSAEVARVRRLLAELRPHGPGAEDPLDGPAEGKGASLAPRTTARAPWDVDAPKGAFQRDPAGEVAAQVVARIGRVAEERPRATLAWLRRSGTLAQGYGPLAVALAWALAGADAHARWAADAEHGRDRFRAWGAARLDEACAAWDAAGRDER